jgi:arylsulfatase A
MRRRANLTAGFSRDRAHNCAMLFRRATLAFAVVLSALPLSLQSQAQPAPRPNVVVFLVDDMGAADLGVTGHPTIKTPHLDQMAREGLRFTSFYSAPACTPARGMFLTSRYPVRTGLLTPTGPAHASGVKADEVTLPEALKAQGYRTGMFGKWHLGDFDTEPAFNPTAHGFDTFLGIPYSHDYNPPKGVPLYRNTQMIEQPVVHSTMTKRFTEEAVRFIRESANRPFFAYVAHPMPHIPIAASQDFHGHSVAGRYGDVVEELDWSVGQVLAALKQRNLDRNTVVVFMSDNGPWLAMSEQLYDRAERGTKLQGEVGWSGVLRGSKGSTWEGGVRVPGIIRWPGTIPAGRVSSDIVSIMDLYPTFVRAAGGRIAADRPIDGVDVTAVLKGTGPSARKELFYFLNANLQAVREGEWKVRVAPPDGAARGAAPAVELFNLAVDPAERHNVAATNPEIVSRLKQKIEAFK